MTLKSNVARFSALLDASDQLRGKSIAQYVQACQLLHQGYGRESGSVESYVQKVEAELKTLGRPRCQRVLFQMWKVGMGVNDGHVARKDVLACTSRAAIDRLIPAIRRPRHKVRPGWTTIRVSLPCHEQLVRIAKRRNETLSEVIEHLLAPPAVKLKVA